MRKTVIILIAVTMIAVSACGSSKKSSSTAGTATTPPGTTAATATTTASTEVSTSASGTTAGTVGTTAPSTSSTFPPVDVQEEKCLYRKRGLLTIGPVPNPSAFGLISMTDADLLALENIDSDMHGTLTSVGVNVYDVGTQDPLQVAATVTKNTNVVASPVLLTTDSGHWTFAPGSDAQTSAVAPDAPNASPDATAPLVAVVDTGYTAPGPKDTKVPAWLKDRVEPLSATADIDVATGRNQGHGRFVASIIVEQDPNVHVVVAAMKDFNPDDYYGFDAAGPNGNKAVWNDVVASNRAEDGYTTDDLQMFGAVWRLIQSKKTFTALNLSVGSYQCDALTVSGLAILAALKLWHSWYPNAPVIAAAGNHTSSVTGPVTGFIPGQLDLQSVPQALSIKGLNLIGVQSVQPNGTTLSAFSNAATTSAIGEGLLGIRLDGESGAYWCGSSFATAIVTANLVASKPPDDMPKMTMDPSMCK